MGYEPCQSPSPPSWRACSTTARNPAPRQSPSAFCSHSQAAAVSDLTQEGTHIRPKGVSGDGTMTWTSALRSSYSSSLSLLRCFLPSDVFPVLSHPNQ